MKKFFRSHPDALLIILALGFIGIVIGYYAWGINDVVSEADRALQVAPKNQAPGFDISTASQLDLRGLLQQSSSSVTP